MSMQLNAQNVIITGGGTGIGFALAQRLVKAGAKVTISGRRADVLDQAKAKLPDVETVAGDITDTDHQDALFAAAQAPNGKWGSGPVTLLINNAGYVTLTKGFPERGGSDEEIAQLFAVNCVAPLQMTRRFIEQAAQGGSVVQIGSLSGAVPVAAIAIYGGTKAGLAHANAGLRTQAARHGVKLLHVETPSTQTPMTADMLVDKMSVEVLADRIVAGIAAERREIRPHLDNHLVALGNRIWPAIPKWISNRRYRDFD